MFPTMDDDTESTEAQASDSVDVADLAANLTAVATERDALADQVLRLRAEFENFRRRAQREREELTEFATMEAVRAVVPVLDDFERALKMECADKDYARGMELIYQRLLESLKKLGIEPIEAEGQKFDPALHHAVEMEKTDRVEDHTILYQHQRGYSFKGKLLRPAIVKVAVEP